MRPSARAHECAGGVLWRPSGLAPCECARVANMRGRPFPHTPHRGVRGPSPTPACLPARLPVRAASARAQTSLGAYARARAFACRGRARSFRVLARGSGPASAGPASRSCPFVCPPVCIRLFLRARLRACMRAQAHCLAASAAPEPRLSLCLSPHACGPMGSGTGPASGNRAGCRPLTRSPPDRPFTTATPSFLPTQILT